MDSRAAMTSTAVAPAIPARLVFLFLLLVAATAGCSLIVSDESKPEVCGQSDRVTLVAETLTPETPSTPFTVAADQQIS